MPSRLIGAPTVPATCVPCPSSSTSAGSLQDRPDPSRTARRSSGSSVVKFRLSDRLKFGAMSGCDAVDAGVDDADAHALVPCWRR